MKNVFSIYFITIAFVLSISVQFAYSQNECPSTITAAKNSSQFEKSTNHDDLYWDFSSYPTFLICHYSENGKLEKEEPTISRNDEILTHGTEKIYFEDGYRIETPYIEGKREGIAKYYNEFRSLIAEVVYKDDRGGNYTRFYLPFPETPYKKECPRHVNGIAAEVEAGQAVLVNEDVTSIFQKPGFECEYNTMLRIPGFWEAMIQTSPRMATSYGSLSRQSEINKDGQRNGVTRNWSYGNLTSISQYVNGMQDGLEQRFHENGRLSAEIQYKHDERDGFLKRYYENGNLAAEAQLKNGIPDGTLKQYRENGELIATITMDNGSPVKGVCHTKSDLLFGYFQYGTTRPLTEAELERSGNKNFECD